MSTEIEELKTEVARLGARLSMLEDALAGLLGDIGIDQALATEHWWIEHESRRMKLGRTSPSGRLRA